MSRFLLSCLAVLCLLVPSSLAFSSVSYDPVFARHMLDVAGATYCHPAQLQSWTCAFCKEEPSFQITGSYMNTTTNMQVVVGFDPNSASIVVAFKGTSPTSIVNWLQDLTFEFLQEECPDCAVHEGFYNTYLSVRYNTIELLQQAMKAHPGAPLTITGHSLGAALATIAAIDLLVVEDILASTVITFGQPRIGNPALTKFYTESFANSTSFRVTHGQDPVPHLPTKAMGYTHDAYEVYYIANNSVWRRCDASGEDPTCADSQLPLNPLAHGTYLSNDFLKQFLACQLWAQEQGHLGSMEVVDPSQAGEMKVSEIDFGNEDDLLADADSELIQKSLANLRLARHDSNPICGLC